MGILDIHFSLAGFERKKIKSYAIYSICAFYIIKKQKKASVSLLLEKI